MGKIVTKKELLGIVSKTVKTVMHMDNADADIKTFMQSIRQKQNLQADKSNDEKSLELIEAIKSYVAEFTDNENNFNTYSVILRISEEDKAIKLYPDGYLGKVLYSGKLCHIDKAFSALSKAGFAKDAKDQA
jgi:hypothetical protein